MEHSSYDLQLRKVTLHHISNFDIDSNMRDMAGDDWINMSIFKTTAILDVGAMDSGVIFDYADNDGSLGSVTTSIFMNNNTLGGAGRRNATNTVHGLAAASNLTGTPTNTNNGPTSPSGGAASTKNDDAMGEQDLPPSANTNVVGANV